MTKKSKSKSPASRPAQTTEIVVIPAGPSVERLTHLTPKPTSSEWSFIMVTSNEHMQKVTQSLTQAYEELNDAARGQVDAVIKSSSALSKGWDELLQSATSIVQQSITQGVSATKAISQAQNLQEALNAQANMVKGVFDSWMAGSGKMTEISTRTAQETLSPIAQHTTSTIEKITHLARAA